MDLKDATKRMIDLSTSHLTKRDDELMPWTKGPGLPRVTSHDYGYIVFVCSEGVTAQIAAMRDAGYSAEFQAIYRDAAQMGGDVMLINFDSAADQVEGLPTFEW